MSKKIIAFIGKIGAGKSTAASYMFNGSCIIIPFASVLKSMLMTMGLTHEEVWGLDKEKSSLLLGGRTPRYAMQTLGTEWGRNLLTPDIWVNCWRRKVDQLPASTPFIFVDDLRFRNEYDAVKNMNGIIIKIINTKQKERRVNHESEAYDFQHDYLLMNNMDTSFRVHCKKLFLEISNTKKQ